MKSLAIAIITCSRYTNRLIHLLQDQDTSLMDHDFKIYSKEPSDYLITYEFNETTKNKWLNYLPLIYQSLRDNIILLDPNASSLLPIKYPANQPYIDLPTWLLPRCLTTGDLSVLSKHLKALNDFLQGSDDCLLIMEDDVIISSQGILNLHKLIQKLSFDFIDIAGGDGLLVQHHDVNILDTFFLENKKNLSTRTACAYLVSRNSAYQLMMILKNPVMPIDWSLSVSLHFISSRLGVYWLDGDFMTHGSSVGAVKSWRSA